ncbi:MAG: flagellar hook-basal body complex protein [Ignavibacteriales bacterium]|nr:flagellar hook-basal body complex protein [Ignavibacteriales bacterium]
MALLTSLFTGVSGMRSHQTMLDVVGNNIANVNSTGYKKSRVTFADMISRYKRYGTYPLEEGGSTNQTRRGGTNAFQVGLGVQVNSIDRNWIQGAFDSTDIVTDVALHGDGLFVLKRDEELFYTRNGGFTFDADGNFINPANGYIVQGKMATEDGVIPTGNYLEDINVDPQMKIPAQATTETDWQGNLSSEATLTRTETVEMTGYFNVNAAIGDTASSTETIYNVDADEFSLTTNWEKTAANTWEMTWEIFDDTGTSVAASAAPIVATFDATTGEMDSFDGVTPPVPINIADTDLQLNFDFDPTTSTELDVENSLAMVADDNRESTLVTGTITVYDSLGTAHQLTLKFTKADSGTQTWKWAASVPDSSGTLTNNEGFVTFNSDGSLNTITPDPPTLGFTPDTGAQPQTIALGFGTSGKFDGMTQTARQSIISSLTQDGAPSATLDNIDIDRFGTITGIFNNGLSRPLARIMLAEIPNRMALVSEGENVFKLAPNTGEPTYEEAGEATDTYMYNRHLEQSNVDLSEEFTRMIVAQRGFQSNSRVVSVSDTLIQEIVNLVR